MRYKKGTTPNLRKVFNRGVQTKIKNTLETEVRRIADEERVRFVDAIRAQRFESFVAFPLSRAYLARKANAGADMRTMIATGTYLDSIQVFSDRQKDKSLRIRIGVDPDQWAVNLEGQTTDILMAEVARIHEYGAPRDDPPSAQRIPARSHWRPFFREIVEDRSKSYRQTVADRVASVILTSRRRNRSR